jgi:citrate synthase
MKVENASATLQPTWWVLTLSDAYLSYAAGINALAGPLHGLANSGSDKVDLLK